VGFEALNHIYQVKLFAVLLALGLVFFGGRSVEKPGMEACAAILTLTGFAMIFVAWVK